MKNLLTTLVFMTALVKADDPEAHMTVEEVVSYHGYPIETYDVTTDDGYILTLHRIPYGKKNITTGGRKVIIIQHGSLANSGFWIADLPRKNLPYLLAERGYDVFLPNIRGNNLGRRHKTLSPIGKAFWDFTFDEMGKHDLPAIFKRVLEVSGAEKFTYVGHSVGTANMFVFLSKNPDYNKVKSFHAMAPVARIGHSKSPFMQLLYEFGIPGLRLLYSLGEDEFLPRSLLWDILSRTLCKWLAMDELICSNVLFIIFGFDYEQFNVTRLPVYMNFIPAGTSTKYMHHWAQVALAKRFQEFNYGKSGNRKRYNQNTPPLYDLSKIKTDIYLYSSHGDWLVDTEDVNWVAANLKNVKEHFVVNHPQFNHIDFAWAKDVIPLLYFKLLENIDASSP